MYLPFLFIVCDGNIRPNSVDHHGESYLTVLYKRSLSFHTSPFHSNAISISLLLFTLSSPLLNTTKRHFKMSAGPSKKPESVARDWVRTILYILTSLHQENKLISFQAIKTILGPLTEPQPCYSTGKSPTYERDAAQAYATMEALFKTASFSNDRSSEFKHVLTFPWEENHKPMPPLCGPRRPADRRRRGPSREQVICPNCNHKFSTAREPKNKQRAVPSTRGEVSEDPRRPRHFHFGVGHCGQSCTPLVDQVDRMDTSSRYPYHHSGPMDVAAPMCRIDQEQEFGRAWGETSLNPNSASNTPSPDPPIRTPPTSPEPSEAEYWTTEETFPAGYCHP